MKLRVTALMVVLSAPQTVAAQAVMGGSSEYSAFRFAPEKVISLQSSDPLVTGTIEIGSVYSRSSKNYAGRAYVFSARNQSVHGVCALFSWEHRGWGYSDFAPESNWVYLPAKAVGKRFDAVFDRASTGLGEYLSGFRKMVLSARPASSPSECS